MCVDVIICVCVSLSAFRMCVSKHVKTIDNIPIGKENKQKHRGDHSIVQ